MFSTLSKLYRHFRAGTLMETLMQRSRRARLTQAMWDGRMHPAPAARALACRVRRLLGEPAADRWILLLGDGDAFHRDLARWLVFENAPFREADLDELAGRAYLDARRATAAARVLARHPVLAMVPLDYAVGADRDALRFDRLDEYRNAFFVSPVLLDELSPYAIYEESLRLFPQKCGLRDYLDLYQMLRWVVRQDVPGEIVEFGSYQGHSGWLIARTLQALQSDKRVFLFDTFAAFPDESLGLDRSWSGAHAVNFTEISEKFRGFDRVQLVRGDFTRTFASTAPPVIALAYADCDSYRATRFVFDALLHQRLSARGVLVCEDYGHPALLGCRAAVHESLEGKRGCFSFFSQFSGLFIVMKLS